MKMYLTLGQDHRHVVNGKVLDKDCVVVIECKDYADGRRIAWELFDDKFCFTYPEDRFDWDKCSSFYPRGLIEVERKAMSCEACETAKRGVIAYTIRWKDTTNLEVKGCKEHVGEVTETLNLVHELSLLVDDYRGELEEGMNHTATCKCTMCELGRRADNLCLKEDDRD